MALYETWDGKPTASTRIATVHVENRNVMILSLDDGTEFKLVR